jgi:hypothetical protein
MMSRRNGDRSRFQINRKRRLRHRERIETLKKALQTGAVAGVQPALAAPAPAAKARKKPGVG